MGRNLLVKMVHTETQIIILLPPANEVWDKVMFFTPVCSQRDGFPVCFPGHIATRVCIQGVSIQGALQETVNKWAVRIVLECIVVLILF